MTPIIGLRKDVIDHGISDARIIENHFPIPVNEIIGEVGQPNSKKPLIRELRGNKPGPASTEAEIYEYLRRVPIENLKAFFRSAHKLQDLKGGEIVALQNQDWGHPIFKSKNLEHYALKAFVQGHIDSWQVSEILLHHETLNIEKKGAVALSIHSDEDLLKEACKDLINDEEFDRFIGSIKDLNPNRTQFYCVPIEQKKDIMNRFLEVDYNFLMIKRGEDFFYIILSPHLLNKLFEAKFGPEFSKINPVLGISLAAKNFQNAYQRDVCIPCRANELSAPIIADNFKATPVTYYFHDVYHAVVINQTPPNHRKAFIELSKEFAPEKYNPVLIKECSADIKQISQLSGVGFEEILKTVFKEEFFYKLLDAEFGMYHYVSRAAVKKKGLSESDLFWSELIMQKTYTFALQPSIPKPLKRKLIETVKNTAICYMEIHGHNFGITAEDFKSLQKKLMANS